MIRRNGIEYHLTHSHANYIEPESKPFFVLAKRCFDGWEARCIIAKESLSEEPNLESWEIDTSDYIT